MKHFYLITNVIKDPMLTLTHTVADYLQAHGCEAEIEGVNDDGTARDSQYRKAHITADTDCILVLGGDGTVLQAAGDALDHNVPVLGINLGTMGYLAEVERNDWQEALDRLIRGEYRVKERMMLEGTLIREDQSTAEGPYVALNDIVFTRNGPMRTLNYEIYVNDRLLVSYHADGVILATPTGSTAYNLSAGGPIVEPGARMILLTPICPHTLNTRSIVLAPDDIIEICIGQAVGDSLPVAEVNFDGAESRVLQCGDRVRICRSDKVTRLVRLHRQSFLDILQRKLN